LACGDVALDTLLLPYYTDLGLKEVTMRTFLNRLLLGVFLLCLAALPGDTIASPGHPGELRVRSFVELAGERHAYTLDFLAFKDLAEASLQMTAEQLPGRYRAELVARTLGIASWLSGERTQRYVSIMEEDENGRLRSISHESTIHKRNGGRWSDRQKRYRFDHQAGKVYQEKGENGKFNPGLVFELPPGETPVDILTGFYNLRAGVYGRLIPGTRLHIPTFTSRGISTIDVEVLASPERRARSFRPGGTLLRIRVDPEVFETRGAALFVWFDEAGRPAGGIVENVIGLGNVHGRLREEHMQP